MNESFKSSSVLRSVFLVAAVAAITATTGCAGPGYGAPAYGSAPSYSGQVYRAGEAQREQRVHFATVEGVRTVAIEKPQSGVGAVGGAVAGGLLGNMAGAGRGKVLTTLGGAVVGGLAGNAVEEHVNRQQGVEITVRMDSGEMRAFVQAADDYFRPGDRVRVLNEGGVSRVTH